MITSELHEAKSEDVKCENEYFSADQNSTIYTQIYGLTNSHLMFALVRDFPVICNTTATVTVINSTNIVPFISFKCSVLK